MKTCRKALGLVLAFAMVLSVFNISAGADFTDQSEITNEEAAAVLTGLGVVEGYDDGSFQPDTVLTREQAAVIIARMLLGDNAEQLSAGSAPFADVDAYRWSAGYIAYCVSEGIIDGYGDGTFGPEDELTCYQFAKMLLCALGYDSESEGFTGSSWAINTTTYAVNAGIFEDVSDYSGSADRDTAALMALNTLKADVVYYPSGNIQIDSGDTSIIISGSSATRVENDSSSDGNIELDGDMQFAERYFTGLELITDADGEYGRPATYTWALDGDIIYSGIDSDSLLETYDSYVTKGTIYSLIGSSVYSDITNSDDEDGELHVFVDGEPYGVDSNGDYTVGTSAVVDPDQVTKFIQRRSSGYAYNADGTDYLSGYGVQTEVYLTDSGDVYLIFINTYLGIAAEDYDEDSGSIDVDYFYNYTVDQPTTGTEVTLEDEDFDIDGYIEGDYILLTFDGGEVASAEPASVVSGEVTGYTEGSSVVVGGTRYYYARNIDEVVDDSTGEFETGGFDINSDITLILDNYGYVLGTSDVSSSSNYLYLIEAARSGNLSSSGYVGAVFFSDGTYDEIDLRGSTFTKADDSTGNYDDTDISGWYSYTVNSSGRYTLTEAEDSVSITDTESPATPGDLSIVNGSVRFLYNDGSRVGSFTGTSTTTFIVYYSDGDYDVYTGYNDVPDISDDTNGITVSAVRNDNDYSIAVIIFVDEGASVSGGGGTSSDSVFVYYDYYGVNVDSDDNTYYSYYYAFLNGEDTTVNVTDTEMHVGLYYDISYDENGYIDEYTEVTGNTDDYMYQSWASTANPGITYSDGVLTLGTAGVYALADSYSIYVIDPDAADYDEVNASGLVRNYKGEFSGPIDVYAVLDDDGYVETLYIVGQSGIFDE